MSQGSDINVSIMSGALDSVPRIVTTKNDNQAVSFSLAVSRQVMVDDNAKSMTSWYNIASYNSSVVETCSKLNKGDKLIIQGALTVRSWVDQATNQKKLRYEIVADRVSLIGSNGVSSSGASSGATETDLPDEIFE